MLTAEESRAQTAANIAKIRAEAEAQVTDLVDAHLLRHFSDASDLFAHCERCCVEVASWPSWKRRTL